MIVFPFGHDYGQSFTDTRKSVFGVRQHNSTCVQADDNVYSATVFIFNQGVLPTVDGQHPMPFAIELTSDFSHHPQGFQRVSELAEGIPHKIELAVDDTTRTWRVHIIGDLPRLLDAFIKNEFIPKTAELIKGQLGMFAGPKVAATPHTQQAAQVVTARVVELPPVARQPAATEEHPQAEVAHSTAMLRARARWGMQSGANA